MTNSNKRKYCIVKFEDVKNGCFIRYYTSWYFKVNGLKAYDKSNGIDIPMDGTENVGVLLEDFNR